MPHINSNRRTPATSAVVLVLLLACLGLAACGGSSKSSSASTNASAATTTTGATAAKGPNAGRGGARFSSPVFKAALAKFATCLRQNGVNVPTPNTSGNGPVFNTKGINTSSAQFRTAETKCRSALVGAFRRGPGGAAPGAGATPPAG